MSARRHDLDPLEIRLRSLLPEAYRDTYDALQPVSMGSAGLRFDAEGRVAWNEIWTTFCDLAMAGGPPHKGALLEAGTRAAIEAEPERQAAVMEEICRGIRMVTYLDVRPSPHAGWVRMTCDSAAMAGWLLRAIVMENVSAHADGRALDLPAAPTYRLEKEIKNVVTVTAKTEHYWTGHLSPVRQRTIGQLFEAMAVGEPLVTPLRPEEQHDAPEAQATAERAAVAIARDTGLSGFDHSTAGWVGIDSGSVRAAVWMMRLIVVGNVLTRREGSTVFVALNPVRDPDGARVVEVVTRVHRLAVARGVMPAVQGRVSG